MIRICIVERDPRIRNLFAEFLKHEPLLVCLGIYGDTAQAECEIPNVWPDVIVMDLADGGAIDCVATLKPLNPEVAFIMLLTFYEPDKIFRAKNAGADACLLKRNVPARLASTIREVYRSHS